MELGTGIALAGLFVAGAWIVERSLAFAARVNGCERSPQIAGYLKAAEKLERKAFKEVVAGYGTSAAQSLANAKVMRDTALALEEARRQKCEYEERVEAERLRSGR